jgi:hypothetical protein
MITAWLSFKNSFILALLGFLFLLIAHGLTAVPVSAQSEAKKNLCSGANLKLGAGSDESDDTGYNRSCTNPSDKSGNPQKGLEGIIATVVNILTVIVGIVAVVMIIIGGFKYITSGGDSGSVTSAKNTIIYAIVGLIVVALAQFIVRFVLNRVGDAADGKTTELLLASLFH